MNDMFFGINLGYFSMMKDNVSPPYNAINSNGYLCLANGSLMQLRLERMVRISINKMYLVFRMLTKQSCQSQCSCNSTIACPNHNDVFFCFPSLFASS